MSFTKKVAVVALFAIVLYVLGSAFNILLMVLGGIIIALYFHGLADLIERNTKLSRKWCMAISVLGSLALLTGMFILMGNTISSQISTLAEKLPQMADQAKTTLSQYKWGQQLLDQVSGKNSQKLISSVKQFFSSTFGVLGDIYVILLLGAFFTAGPDVYKKGIIALIPPDRKDDGAHTLDALSGNLKSWFKGKLFSMAIVAVLTAIGLWIIGVPMVITLALIAGLLNFVPNFGPIIAMVPAVLIGLSQGINTALIIAGMYILIQTLESNLITPYIQNKLVRIPPALIIIGQLVVGIFSGYLGLILATPVVLIVMVLVKELYVKKIEEKAK